MFVVSLVVLVAAAGPDVFHTVEGWGGAGGIDVYFGGKCSPPPRHHRVDELLQYTHVAFPGN